MHQGTVRVGKLAAAVVILGAVAGAWQAQGADNTGADKPMQVKTAAPADHDPYLWLADIHGQKALGWAKAQTAKSDAVLKTDPEYAADRDAILKVLNASDRIPEGSLHGEYVLNFWQDKDHVRGLWRRTTIADYATKAPHWQVLLDLDKLDKDSGQNWVWKGADCTKAFDRCLVRLSPGGGDAHVIREFDPKTGEFLKDGFDLPLAKSNAVYLNDDTVLFATDFGTGSMTPSSYPRIVKLWHRGEKLADAKTVFEGQPDDMVADPVVTHDPYGHIALIVRSPSFFTAEYYLVRDDGSTLKLPLPLGAQLQGVTGGQLIATLRNAWTPDGQKTIPQGSLISFPILDYARTGKMPKVATLYTPGPRAMIGSVSAGRDAVYASIYEDVTGAIHAFRFSDGAWHDTKLALPAGGSTDLVSTNDFGPEAYFTYQSFLTPPTLYAYDGKNEPKAIKAQAATFDASKISVAQRWATSKDGTRIPYFLIRPKAAKGAIPTILYGYGGFELSLTPWYWNDGHRPLDAGPVWLEKGGAIAVANIRGGGEFGPKWHQAALKYHRQRAYDDFEAVAADIEKDGLSTPKMLGIVGASNGGLLVSTVMVERPDLLAAVVCQRPLIDMLRYTRYGAGASWVGEYGDPADPKMAAYIRTYSPYENVKADVKYPPILFITETSDDRVTPIWARMMAAKMEAQGHDVLFNEASEGGHGPGSTHAEEANYWALSYTFFKRKLGLK
ncbi:MAG: S9 family peptidase [Alphaproteobacteria bacterium]|nr:S9 family peptidase [Alphaproteobacteria bacterium]MDE2353032.1 S9 family peptidase [Alphaproteobacteria bacterium]